MRKIAILSALLLSVFVLCAIPAEAGGLGVFASTWDTDTADDDQGGGVKLQIDTGAVFEFQLRGTFFDSFTQVDRGELYEIEAAPIDLGVVYNFGADRRVNPYLGAGGTFLLLKPNAALGSEEISRPRSQEEFGFYGEVGLEVQIKGACAFFIEALYRDASGEVRGRDLGTAPNVDFEVDFGGASANIGLMLSW